MNAGEFKHKIKRYPSELQANSLAESITNAKKLLIGDINMLKDNLLPNFTNRSLKKKIEGEFKIYMDIANCYSAGDIAGAFGKMSELLFDRNGQSFVDVDEFKRSSGILFRARSSQDYHIYSKEEMFHVPFNSCAVIGNQRYSISGFPCLYLGASLYDCWEELRRTNLEKLNYVGYRYAKSKPLRFMLIAPPRLLQNWDDIKQLILFMLCTYIVNDDSKKFKFEYVMPELVLHTLINKMTVETGTAKNSINFDGIAYISSRFYKQGCLYPKDHSRMMNYVIPIREGQSEEKFCKVLKDLFELSEVDAWFNHKVRGTLFSSSMVRPTEYALSLFRQLENEIERKRKFSKL